RLRLGACRRGSRTDLASGARGSRTFSSEVEAHRGGVAGGRDRLDVLSGEEVLVLRREVHVTLGRNVRPANNKVVLRIQLEVAADIERRGTALRLVLVCGFRGHAHADGRARAA